MISMRDRFSEMTTSGGCKVKMLRFEVKLSYR